MGTWRSFSPPAEFVALASNNRGGRPEENLSSESTGTLAKIDQWRSFSSPAEFVALAFNNRDGRPEGNLSSDSTGTLAEMD